MGKDQSIPLQELRGIFFFVTKMSLFQKTEITTTMRC
jgi:hypothetical protein